MRPSTLSRLGIMFRIEWWLRGIPVILVVALLSGCAWVPVAYTYPSGLSIVRADQYTLDKICPKTSDEGTPIKHASGCYDKAKDTIWILNSCVGAQTIPHEFGHREGIEKPSKEGFDW